MLAENAAEEAAAAAAMGVRRVGAVEDLRCLDENLDRDNAAAVAAAGSPVQAPARWSAQPFQTQRRHFWPHLCSRGNLQGSAAQKGLCLSAQVQCGDQGMKELLPCCCSCCSVEVLGDPMLLLLKEPGSWNVHCTSCSLSKSSPLKVAGRSGLQQCRMRTAQQQAPLAASPYR